MRFLDDRYLDVAKLGKPFPLKLSLFSQLYTRQASLAGGKTVRLVVDIGDTGDGHVDRDSVEGSHPGWMHFSKCVWNGKTYTNVNIGSGGDSIGLRFLARHLVTFDFPKRVMYLKQTSVGPLIDASQKAERAATAHAAAKSALQFAMRLKKEGQLPGWSKREHGATTTFHVRHSVHGDYVTLEARKDRDSSLYHYTFSRASQNGPWKLQRAWRTDKDGRTVQEFSVP